MSFLGELHSLSCSDPVSLELVLIDLQLPYCDSTLLIESHWSNRQWGESQEVLEKTEVNFCAG